MDEPYVLLHHPFLNFFLSDKESRRSLPIDELVSLLLARTLWIHIVSSTFALIENNVQA